LNSRFAHDLELARVMTFSVEPVANLLFSLPEIGVGAGNCDELTEREAALLRELDLAHVRCELELDTDGLEVQVERIAVQTEAIAGQLELALTLVGTSNTLDLFVRDSARAGSGSLERWHSARTPP